MVLLHNQVIRWILISANANNVRVTLESIAQLLKPIGGDNTIIVRECDDIASSDFDTAIPRRRRPGIVRLPNVAYLWKFTRYHRLCTIRRGIIHKDNLESWQALGQYRLQTAAQALLAIIGSDDDRKPIHLVLD